MDGDDKKSEDEAAEPARDAAQEEGAELREVSEDELEQILAAHKTWVETEGKEGEQADLSRTKLLGANLRGANLGEANLQRAYLRSANLKGASLYNANLQGANLYFANLRGAYLGGANLERAHLGQAELQGANLFAAKLQGADLSLANLEGADLTEAKSLTRKQLDEACGDDETKLPDYLADYEMKPC